LEWTRGKGNCEGPPPSWCLSTTPGSRGSSRARRNASATVDVAILARVGSVIPAPAQRRSVVCRGRPALWTVHRVCNRPRDTEAARQRDDRRSLPRVSVTCASTSRATHDAQRQGDYLPPMGTLSPSAHGRRQRAVERSRQGLAGTRRERRWCVGRSTRDVRQGSMGTCW
jgi:hypothetical protein